MTIARSIVRPLIPPILTPLSGGALPWDPVSGQPWTPAALGSAVKIWLRGDLGVTLSAAEVTDWADQSGNAFHFAAAANRPTTRTVNGRTAIDFDGTNDRITSTGDTSAVLGTPASLDIYVVFIADALAAVTGFSAPNLCGQNTNNYWTFSAGSGGLYQIITDAGSVPRTATSGTAPSTDVVYRGRGSFDGATASAKTGSGAAGTAACVGHLAASYTTNKMLLGWNASQNAFFNGAICELLVFTTPLTTAQGALLDQWLAARWGATT